jgi:hypothetical protein
MNTVTSADGTTIGYDRTGAVLALRAAAALPGKVRRVAAYEPPVVVDASRTPVPAGYRQHVADLVAAGRNGDVVKYFMTAGVGLSAIVAALMRFMPALVADGGKSPAWIHNGVQAVADAVPEAQRQTLPGQTHQVKAAALAPVLVEFSTGEAA